MDLSRFESYSLKHLKGYRRRLETSQDKPVTVEAVEGPVDRIANHGAHIIDMFRRHSLSSSLAQQMVGHESEVAGVSTIDTPEAV
jgi:hypothetical protein